MVTELEDLSMEEIQEILESDVFAFPHRATRIVHPYNHNDFVKTTGFIPDLVIALLMTANFAGAPVWLKNAVPQNKKVATVANQQSRTQANCINYFTALQKVKGR